MPFRVEYSEEAKYDLDLILEWLLAREAGETGLRWFRNFKDAILSLAEFPRRCPQAPEAAEFPFEVRQMVYGRKPHHYRVLFTVDGDAVIILHIRHGRRRRISEPH